MVWRGSERMFPVPECSPLSMSCQARTQTTAGNHLRLLRDPQEIRILQTTACAHPDADNPFPCRAKTGSRQASTAQNVAHHGLQGRQRERLAQKIYFIVNQAAFGDELRRVA